MRSSISSFSSCCYYDSCYCCGCFYVYCYCYYCYCYLYCNCCYRWPTTTTTSKRYFASRVVLSLGGHCVLRDVLTCGGDTATTADKTVVELTAYLEHQRVLWDPYDHSCKERRWRTSSCFVVIARRTCRKPEQERETYTPRPSDTSKHAAPTGRYSHADIRTYTTLPIHRSAAEDLNTIQCNFIVSV